MTDAPRNCLLIEDNPDNPDDEELTIRELAHAKLKNRVDVARDDREAIDYLLGSENMPPGPSRQWFSSSLSKVGSLEILRRIRSEEEDPPTAGRHPDESNEDTDVVNGYDTRANSYVCKPIQFDAFAAAVAQLGAHG